MIPESINPADDDQQYRHADPFEDLGNAITVGDATQVKGGGFDPQPEPPRLLDPRQISAKFLKS
jgi:hypothetical protein